MFNTFSFCEYGDVTLRNAIFDTNGTDLVEGIEISSDNNEFETIEIHGYIDLDELEADDVEKLIQENIK